MATDTPTPGTLRRIASEWYDGPLYRFVSTGTIDRDVRDEARQTALQAEAGVYGQGDTIGVEEVGILSVWLDSQPDRGPQPGWPHTWEEAEEVTR